MELTTSLQTLTRSTSLELDKAITWQRSNEGAIDLVALINSRMKEPLRPVVSREVEVFADIDRTLRQRSGAVANGTWLPLVALTRPATRDLDSVNGLPLKTGSVASAAATTLLPTSGLISGGAQILSGINSATLSLPYLSGGTGAAAWHAEGQAPAAPLEPSFKLATVVPKSICVELVVSRRLLMNTAIDLNELLRQEIAQRFGSAIDAAALNGDGVLEPDGLLNQAGLDVLALGPDGEAITHADLAELEARVLSRANGSMEKPAWVIGPKMTRKLRTTAKNAGAMIFEGNDLLGHQVIQTSAMPENLTKGTSTDCAAIVFGDLAEVFVGFWGPAAVDLMIDAYTMAKEAKVRIIARAEVGIVARRIGAFAGVKDALTT